MNLQQLEYIISLDTHRHFSKAAEASFVTQPTLSMMIQRLEEELGVKIFDRSQLPIRPTEIGAKIIEQARTALAQVNQINEIVEESKGVLKGTFRIGIIPTISPYLLPKLMQVHQINMPELNILVFEQTTPQIIKNLSLGTIDAGILATPLNEPEIKTNPIYYEKFYAYISPKDPLYVRTSVDENDIGKSKLWLLEEVHCFRSQILHLCQSRKRKSSESLSFEAGSINTLVNIVDQNDGITVIPEMAINTLTDEQKKNVRPFKNSTPVREISLITRKDFFKERILNILLDEVKLAVPKPMRDEALKKFVIPL